MKVAIVSDYEGKKLKDALLNELTEYDFTIIDPEPKGMKNAVESSKKAASMLKKNEVDRAIVIDKYGVGSFIAMNKHKHVICAEVSEEHSAKMTRAHNNANSIALGSGIVGLELAKNICLTFIRGDYEGGRHQIRVDMLNRLA